MQEMKQSWAVASVRPYDVYMKTLYTLVRDRLEGEDDKDILWDNEITKRPADFQKVAVRQAVQIVKDYGGAVTVQLKMARTQHRLTGWRKSDVACWPQGPDSGAWGRMGVPMTSL